MDEIEEIEILECDFFDDCDLSFASYLIHSVSGNEWIEEHYVVFWIDKSWPSEQRCYETVCQYQYHEQRTTPTLNFIQFSKELGVESLVRAGIYQLAQQYDLLSVARMSRWRRTSTLNRKFSTPKHRFLRKIIIYSLFLKAVSLIIELHTSLYIFRAIVR